MEIWPSLRFGAQALALRRAAKRPRAQIERIQRARLEDLVCHARRRSVFYRDKFAGLHETRFALADLPPSTKPELMENFEQALTVEDLRREEVEAFFRDEANVGKLFRGKYVLSHTSGSQGQPLLLVMTDDVLSLLFTLQAARGNREGPNVWQIVKHLTSPARLAAVTLQRGFYPSATAFEYMPSGAKRFIDTLRLSLGDKEMTERLQQFRPTHLTAYATVLHELARQIEQGRLTLQPELRQVVNISERLIPQARKRYESVFGAPILDDYAMGECLFLSHGCFTTPGMHVNSDWAVLEVVDEHNRPVPNGQRGAKVLLTNLANRVQPIIRYEVGDVVTMATEPCSCGSNLPLIRQVEGRNSDVFWIRTDEGDRPVTPAVFEIALSKIVEVREFQLVQEDSNRFRIRIEPLAGAEFDKDQAAQIIHKQLEQYQLRRHLHVEIEAVKRLTPADGKKFRRVLSQKRQAS
jgi:phenylacetate-coenzyme A ligase PaaK-like adenylate-forming protein